MSFISVGAVKRGYCAVMNNCGLCCFPCRGKSWESCERVCCPGRPGCKSPAVVCKHRPLYSIYLAPNRCQIKLLVYRISWCSVLIVGLGWLLSTLHLSLLAVTNTWLSPYLQLCTRNSRSSALHSCAMSTTLLSLCTVPLPNCSPNMWQQVECTLYP